MERRLPQRDILLKVLVVLGLVPALALVAGSTRNTSSFYYDSQRIEGSISAGEWSTLPGVPAACLDWPPGNGNGSLKLTAADVVSWVSKSHSVMLSVEEVRAKGFDLVVLDGPSGTYGGPGNAGQPSGRGQLIVVLSGDWVVTGTGYKDIVLAGPGHTVVQGGHGSDCLVGGSGTSVLDGGNHTDLLIGGSGPTTVEGGNSGDLLIAGTGTISLSGGNGPDIVAWKDSCSTPGKGDNGPQNHWVWSGDPAAPAVSRCPAPRVATLTAEPELQQQAEPEQPVEPEVATQAERSAPPAPAPQPAAPPEPSAPAQPQQPVQPDEQGPADQQPEQVDPEQPAPTTQATSPTGEAGPTDDATASP